MVNKHSHRTNSDQPLMFKCGGHIWHLLRNDGTDETEVPTGIDPLTLPPPKRKEIR